MRDSESPQIYFSLILSAILSAFLLLSAPAEAQTEILKNIGPGNDDGQIEQITVVDSLLFFVADENDEIEAELFVTDGTPAGTKRISHIDPSGSRPNIEEITPLGSQVIFTADTDEYGRELYISDGTFSGTGLLKDINPDDGYSEAENFVEMNGKAYFPAEDGTYPDADNGEELWVTDGSSGGTYLLKDLDPGQYLDTFSGTEKNYSSRPDHFFAHNDTLYFSARHHDFGEELWATDGTPEGTYMVKDIFTGSNGSSGDSNNNSSPTTFNVINGTVLFNAESDSTYTRYLYTTDGTAAGTKIFINEEVHIREKPVEYDGAWYFISDTKLWKSDGTADGTSAIIDLAKIDNVIEDRSDMSAKLFNLNDKLYFFSTYALWETDGTASGTIKAVDYKFNLTDFAYSQSSFATVFNNRIYFAGSDDGYQQAEIAGQELWTTDGTPEGTMYVANLRTGTDRGLPDGSDPQDLNVFNDKLYFIAEGDSNGREIWMTDGIPVRKFQIMDTVLTANIPDFGATINFSNLTDTLDLQTYLKLDVNPDSIHIPDSLTLASSKIWNLKAQTGGSFDAEVCLSSTNIDLTSSNSGSLDIIKRGSATEDWKLLSAGPNEDDKMLCAEGVQSFSEFTIVRLPESESDTTTVFNEHTKNPVTFKLEQAYPNPFNPSTTIDYRISEPGKVTLLVYDVMGRLVSTLVNKRQNSGRHTVTFNAQNLASGVYFYRLEAGNNIQIKRMTLLK